MSKKAFITGITGQDGSYLAELLLSKGYEVHGLIRRASNFNTQRIDHLYAGEQVTLHYGDLTDGGALSALLKQIHPDEVYNLGAQSHVRVSFDQPEYTLNVTGVGTMRLLEAVRGLDPMPRFYQASSSEMFGSAPAPQSEATPFEPRSPYACAKVMGHYQTINYREAYGLHGSCGILFNHESPRRHETFVTRKITRAMTRIKLGLQDRLILGNLDAKRDWGFAGDYVEAMWLMLQQDEPDDYVVATGETYSVRDFVIETAKHLDIDWEEVTGYDKRYERPSEVDLLLGDASKAHEKLGWRAKVTFSELVARMVAADMELAERERALINAGLLPGKQVKRAA